MTAQPLGMGPVPIPRTYNSISAALPDDDGGGLIGDFTDQHHAADVFSAPRTLEYWGRIADELADPATYAALDRARPTLDGISLFDVLDQAEADR
ncbi:hypothetical protein ACFWA9_10130 [Kitasatospora sp. NPDC059973]|uniref:hypothetical protein n=1 Tax=Kitasatospora sp. NPDC059973 TaxID=3347020 RepID=UPI003698206A